MANFPTNSPDFDLRRKHRTLLRIARGFIADGTCTFICNALREAVEQLTETEVNATREYNELTRFIMRTLAGRHSLDQWQSQHGIKRTRKQRRKDRKKWIDFLLACEYDDLACEYDDLW